MNRPCTPQPSPAKSDRDTITIQVEANRRRTQSARKIVEQLDLYEKSVIDVRTLIEREKEVILTDLHSSNIFFGIHQFFLLV